MFIKLKKYLRKFNSKYATELALYEGIKELPVWNWNEASETGNLKHLLKKPLRRFDSNVLHDAYFRFQDEIIDCFGFTKEQQKILLKEQQITWLTCQVALNLDSPHKTKLAIARIEYEEIVSRKESSDFYEHVAIIEQYKGFSINLKEVTLYMWLVYKKIYEEHVKQIKRNKKA